MNSIYIFSTPNGVLAIPRNKIESIERVNDEGTIRLYVNGVRVQDNFNDLLRELYPEPKSIKHRCSTPK